MWFLQPGPAHWRGLSELSAAGMERRGGGKGGHLQEEVLHDVVVVGGAAVREEAGGKDNDGVETFAVVPWERQLVSGPRQRCRALSEL